MPLLRIFGCILFVGMIHVPAHAQSSGNERLELVGDYQETYLQNPKVAGSLLLGVSFAGRAEQFDAGRVKIDFPSSPVVRRACISLSSKDGLYSAENLYTIPSTLPGWKDVPTGTHFQKQLSTYSTDDLAVLARESPSCDDPEPGTIVPVVKASPHQNEGGGAREGRVLVALVNADPARVAVSIAGDDADVHGRCSAPGEGVRIAFSARCELQLPVLKAGTYKLQLDVRDRFETTRTEFNLLLGP